MDVSYHLLESYLSAGQSFHFARKQLPSGPPERLHQHDYYECFWLESGQVLHWVNDQQVTLGVGELVFIRPSDCHGFEPLGERACVLNNISFDQAVAAHLVQRYRREFSGRFFWSDMALPETYALSLAQQTMLRRQLHDLVLEPCSLAVIECFLLNIMTRLHRIEVTHHSGQMPVWLSSACRQVRQPELFREGVSALVRLSGHGHAHVCRVMREYTELSPSQYINRLRMDYASRLLSSTDQAIPDVANTCGLDNLSHFYQLFKRQFGMTPKAYRHQYRIDLID